MDVQITFIDLPLDTIGHIISFLCGRQTCDNFLTFCEEIFERDIRTEIHTGQIAMAEYGLANCRSASWPLFVRTTGPKHVAHVKYYQSLGIEVNTQEFIDSLIATQSIDALDYLRWSGVITNFKKIWAYNHLRILQQNLLESFKFLAAQIDIDRASMIRNLQNCTGKTMLKFLFNKYNFTMQEIFPEIWFYDRNQVLLRFTAKKFKAHAQDFPQSQLQNAPYPTLIYVYDFLKFPLPSRKDQDLMLWRNFTRGHGQVFFYLMELFKRADFDVGLPPRHFNRFLNRCDAKILEFVLKRQKCYYTNENETCACDGRCFCDGITFEPKKLAQNMTKKKFRLMHEHGCFTAEWQVFELNYYFGAMANISIYNILRKYYKDGRYVYDFIDGLLMSDILRKNDDLAIQFITENNLNKKIIKEKIPDCFIYKNGTVKLLEFLKIDPISTQAKHAIAANNNTMIAWFSKKAIKTTTREITGPLTVETFFQLQFL